MPYKNIESRREAHRRDYQKHKKQIFARKKRNKTIRLTSLGTANGIIHGLHKRKYPKNNICELCETRRNRLVYHHWDDNDYNKGMWVCNFCHWFAERKDKGFDEKYIKVKKRIEIEMPLHMASCKKILKKDSILNLLKKGYKSIEISQILNVNKHYVSQIKGDFNIPTVFKWTQEKTKFLIDNYGILRPMEIAEKLGFNLLAIYQKKFKLKKKGLITQDLDSHSNIIKTEQN